MAKDFIDVNEYSRKSGCICIHFKRLPDLSPLFQDSCSSNKSGGFYAHIYVSKEKLFP